MAKLTLTNGTIFEGTAEEIFAITERFNGVKADEPIAESLTHNGVEYTKVDRKAQVGDVVIFKDGISQTSWITLGKPYKTISGRLEPSFRADDGDETNVYEADYRKRTTETVIVYEPKSEAVPTPLKVGDYAVVEGYSAEHNGTLVELTSKWTMEKDKFDVMPVVDSSVRSMGVKYLRKATDAEVAEAKASVKKAAKEAVFTQAGRKPNEYRKGDIVRISDEYNGHSVNKAGDIGVIAAVESFGGFRVVVDGRVGSGNYHGPNNVVPVTFAESRLDK